MSLEGAIDLPGNCSGEFIWPHEKEGGNPWNPGKRRYLREFMQANNLIDIQFKGQQFTWSNNWPNGGLIKIRLERWPALSVFHFPMIGSDHYPLVIDTDPPSSWIEDSECLDIISEAWSNQAADNLAQQQWTTNLHQCSKNLKQWSKKFSNNRIEIDSNIEKLQVLQQSPDPEAGQLATSLTDKLASL